MHDGREARPRPLQQAPLLGPITFLLPNDGELRALNLTFVRHFFYFGTSGVNLKCAPLRFYLVDQITTINFFSEKLNYFFRPVARRKRFEARHWNVQFNNYQLLKDNSKIKEFN